jgi:signal transduction histidine kinase
MSYARDYAAAGEISIMLDMSNDPIKITINDNGRGFDADAAFSTPEEHAQDPRVQGLITLREKYELTGGAVSVFSSETEGTEVRMELPTNT